MSIYFAKNFKYAEIACPCCGKVKPIDSKLIFLLQSLREKINQPIYISKGGGIRCREYNKKVGGYKYSPHLQGRAVDISVKNMDITVLANLAMDIGFSRVGLYPDNHFIHIDIIRPWRSSSWVKYKGEKPIYFKTLEEAIECAGGY